MIMNGVEAVAADKQHEDNNVSHPIISSGGRRP